ncbi:MAG: zinc-dependent alcohol dehydrogenase family protein [Deltaproteobacteria bacterium]|nr:zinc-dependent alcohol dehydrogenase family protein [Deltaproteobacteria bacterium]
MRAMVLEQVGAPLVARQLAVPHPGPGEVRLAVDACGVCRTDLHIIDGELPDAALPRVLGHQVVGTVAEVGAGVTALAWGDRVGVPWLAWTCGSCHYCASERENLCSAARFTGYHRDGGFAEACIVDARYVFRLPAAASPVQMAPLLCAGMIGYRALRFAAGARLGLYGFGAAGHLVAQLARHQGREIYAFTRPGDLATQAFAREIGATWAGDSDRRPPVELDAAILFAPVGALVPLALAAVAPGGTVVCAGIHMSDIPAFPYQLLWQERSVRSVANLTRADGRELLALAGPAHLHPHARVYPLAEANRALDDLRAGRGDGAAVLVTR